LSTIVQNYGPIYGEVVNGTVQGRPNGSVYVPISNTISLDINPYYRYVNISNSWYTEVTDSAGAAIAYAIEVSAQSQDLSSLVRISLYSDAACTTLVAQTDRTAGEFNLKARRITTVDATGISVGDTLYYRVELINNNTAVATSSVVPVEVVNV